MHFLDLLSLTTHVEFLSLDRVDEIILELFFVNRVGLVSFKVSLANLLFRLLLRVNRLVELILSFILPLSANLDRVGLSWLIAVTNATLKLIK